MTRFGDCHIHIALDGVDFHHAGARSAGGETEQFVLKNLARYKEKGVTFLRDGGDKWGASEFAAQAAPDFGIDYRTPVFPIHRRGNYGSFLGRAYDTMSDYRALVHEASSRGCDFIKLMTTGMMDFDRNGELTGFALDADELTEMVSIAHGEGFAVMVHVNRADNVKRVLEAGADSIEHGYFIDEEALVLLRERGAVWVPTIAPVHDLIPMGTFDGATLKGIVNRQKMAVKRARELGCLVAAGSDAGSGGVFHGDGFFDELTLLREALGDGADEYLAAGQREIEIRFRKI